jgi:hypothetical protein
VSNLPHSNMNSSKPSARRSIKRRGFLAPIASAVVMAAVGAWGLGVPLAPVDEAYLAKVAAAIDAIPYNVDGMMGQDAEPTPAAVKMLRPNRILQRQYVDPNTGEASSLLVVHCADMRDMLGHYPPVCYPAHGWVVKSVAPTKLEWDGKEYPARLYQFTRSGGEMSQQHLTVLSFFVLPGERPVVADMDHLEQAARKPEIAGRGAAQFQVLWLHGPDQSSRESATKALIKAALPAIRSVCEGSKR